MMADGMMIILEAEGGQGSEIWLIGMILRGFEMDGLTDGHLRFYSRFLTEK